MFWSAVYEVSRERAASNVKDAQSFVVSFRIGLLEVHWFQNNTCCTCCLLLSRCFFTFFQGLQDERFDKRVRVGHRSGYIALTARTTVRPARLRLVSV